jgi:iron complex outermembrane recepter protein
MKHIAVFLCLYLSNVSFAIDEIAQTDLSPHENLEINVTDNNLYKPELLQDLSEASLSYKVIDQKTLSKMNAQKISDITQIDTSLSESYSAIGYSDSVSIRGVLLSSQNNFLRDGLPFLVDAPVQFENKSKIEMIKGTYGIFSGLSSPGGIINYVTKKPTAQTNKTIQTEITSAGQIGASTGASSAFDEKKNYLYRFDLAATKLNENLKNSAGQKYLASVGLLAAPLQNLSIETGFEYSYQSQPSQPGFSLLGSKVPTNIDPNLNLNNQSWTQPVEFKNLMGSMNLKYKINNSTAMDLSALGQKIITNDRVAFPFGCTAENNFDRFCSDGTYDMYDYRSEHEKRNSNAYRIQFNHKFQFHEIQNTISISALNRQISENYDDNQAYNFVGTGNVQGTIQNPENDLRLDKNTNKKSNTNEFTFFYNLQFKKMTLTLGLKNADLEKHSVKTDETQKTDIAQNFLLPWATLAYANKTSLIYTSYSEGIESYVTPNKPSYNFPGQNIPDAKSKQIEIGFKSLDENSLNISLFKMTRPQIEDSAPNYQIDGQQKNIGSEISYQHTLKNYNFEFSGLILDSHIENAEKNPFKNNKSVTNIPLYKLQIDLDYRVPSVRGLSLKSATNWSSERFVTADNEIKIPAWANLNLGLEYEWHKNNTLILTVTNVTNEHYWKESPTQFGHIYLFPGESRKLTLNYTKELN